VYTLPMKREIIYSVAHKNEFSTLRKLSQGPQATIFGCRWRGGYPFWVSISIKSRKSLWRPLSYIRLFQ